MKKTLAFALSAASALAQPTGDWGMMMRDGLYGSGPSLLWLFLSKALMLGLTLLVWLWVVKVWRELRAKKK